MIILDPDLIKAGTKQMKAMLQQLKKKVTALDRHNALLQYYTESSFARIKAVWYVNSTFLKNILIYFVQFNVDITAITLRVYLKIRENAFCTLITKMSWMPFAMLLNL